MLPVSEQIAQIEQAATEVENIATPGDGTQPEVAVADGGVVDDMLAHAATILVSTVIFWGYMWGLAGALVAVPIIVSTKIVFSHVPDYRPLATLFRR